MRESRTTTGVCVVSVNDVSSIFSSVGNSGNCCATNDPSTGA